jgi:hypothetical protein
VIVDQKLELAIAVDIKILDRICTPKYAIDNS